MKLLIKKVSDRNYERTVEVETIQDLLNLCSEYNDDIIVRQPRYKGSEYSLLVYDNYLE